jgi:hypothetical protein
MRRDWEELNGLRLLSIRPGRAGARPTKTLLQHANEWIAICDPTSNAESRHSFAIPAKERHTTEPPNVNKGVRFAHQPGEW